MNLNSLRQQILERAAGSASFRSRLLEDAAAAIMEETGFPVPEGLSIAAHDDPVDGLQVVVSGATSLRDAELTGVVGGSFMNSQYETEAEADAAWEAQFPGTVPPWKTR